MEGLFGAGGARPAARPMIDRRWAVAIGTALTMAGTLYLLLGLTPERWVDHPGPKAESASWRASTALAETALLLLAVTMVQGPIRVLRGSNPAVHRPWRRAFGVMAAVAAAAHATVGLTIHGELLRPWGQFVTGRPTLADPFPLLGGPRGLANHIGLLLVGLLAALAITSNRAMMRRLGRRWKPLQRCSYLAGLCVAAHVVLYQQVEQRLLLHRLAVLSVVVAAASVQVAAALVVRRRARRAGPRPQPAAVASG